MAADTLTLVEAVAEGLHDEMARDESVVVLGEDVGRSGGVFRATEGLRDAFGPDRVVDTPLTETGIAGAAIGLAASGLRPVAEIQFMGFTYAALEQLFTRAARMNARSRGQFPGQLVVRAPFGGGVRAPDLHGESMEAIFVHHPGFKVIVPSTPRDAKGLLTAAIRDPDPVLFFEPKKIYRAFREAVPEGTYEVPIGDASVRREGEDVSAFTWGAMTRPTLDAADELAEEIDVEVVDLRTLSPMDRATIVDSFKKTGRAVVVHEAPRTGGLAGEITALLQEEALFYQEAPIARVTGWDAVYPLYELEDFQLPNATRVTEAIREVSEV
ncbi:alpha-ketoacid dehydrogenase subunit beta [Halosolutus halophilus]|uniref:alpha-ketoacid dehydrogenase subunit beta n=1 Tax=Halosolutus halophilus TaxID=1552990 RepID=UPI002234FDE6|nr:alpha-ketoacid dehydrogenase subunit beta [Halosolutus halophilus]